MTATNNRGEPTIVSSVFHGAVSIWWLSPFTSRGVPGRCRGHGTRRSSAVKRRVRRQVEAASPSRTGLIQEFDRRGVQLEPGCLDQVAKLLEACCTCNRCGHAGARAQPGEGHPSRRRTEPRGNLVESPQDAKPAFVQVFLDHRAPGALRQVLFRLVLPCQEPARE